jgi:Derlin-2/3
MDGGRLPLETWFWEMPICTRWWTVATIMTSALVQFHMVTPFQLFYSFRAVFVKSQVRWMPLVTSAPPDQLSCDLPTISSIGGY